MVRDKKMATRWISVVFLQESEADVVLDLIDKGGADAGIEYLMQWDYGEETTDAALINGYVYDTIPAGVTDRIVEHDDGEYVLGYSTALGHASLLRRYNVAPDPVLLREDRQLQSSHEWFGAQRAHTAPHTRGVAL